MRSARKKREVEHALKCHKELYSEKKKKTTQLTMKNFFSKQHGISYDCSASAERSTTMSPQNSTSPAKGSGVTAMAPDSSDVDEPEIV